MNCLVSTDSVRHKATPYYAYTDIHMWHVPPIPIFFVAFCPALALQIWEMFSLVETFLKHNQACITCILHWCTVALVHCIVFLKHFWLVGGDDGMDEKIWARV